MEFYTYAYLREDGRPYYIGKGKGGRMFANHKHVNLPPNENNIIKLKTNLSEEEAMRHEIYLISVLGRKDLGTGILINLTDGGEGSSGRETSEITKQKLREAGRRRSHSDETRRKMSESQKKAAKTKEGREARSKGGSITGKKNLGRRLYNDGLTSQQRYALRKKGLIPLRRNK